MNWRREWVDGIQGKGLGSGTGWRDSGAGHQDRGRQGNLMIHAGHGERDELRRFNALPFRDI